MTELSQTNNWQVAVGYCAKIVIAVLFLVLSTNILNGSNFDTLYYKTYDRLLIIMLIIHIVYFLMIYVVSFLKMSVLAKQSLCVLISFVYWVIASIIAPTLYQIFENKDWFGEGLVSNRLPILLILFFIINQMNFARYVLIVFQVKSNHWFLSLLTFLAIMGFGYWAVFFSLASSM